MTEGAALWQAVDDLLDGAEVAGIRAHKLGALAARLRRSDGRPVPPPLAADERGAAVAVIMARPLLEHIRRVCDGALVLVKGPEVARLYPGSARTFGDVDLFAADAPAAQRALLANGYVEVDDPEPFVDHHHLRPLKAPTVGLKVELHTAPLWPPGTTPPPLQEILERAVPAGVGVEGISTPVPVHHALILAAHAWSHDPLQTLRDLVDIAAVSAGCSDAELAQAAEAWGIPKIWRTTRGAIRALLEGGPTTVPLRIWARHLRSMRERTVLDSHLMRWLHVFWELPPRAAVADLRTAVRMTLLPAGGESWREKLARTGRGITHPGEPMSTHLEWSREVRRRRRRS
ncbi:MAG TPA: nucleotidyltransferase family protein [Gaiellaceae bacterium]|nr:nucleotidyltransferase family protein [Gaiellaceae bacterium]